MKKKTYGRLLHIPAHAAKGYIYRFILMFNNNKGCIKI